MSIEETPRSGVAYKLPFHVVTKETGSFAASYSEKAEAVKSAADRSQQAKSMGIAARYEAIANPDTP